MKTKADVMLTFIESIYALGGRITPDTVEGIAAVRDFAELTVIVPRQHQVKADELIAQFYIDLAGASPS